MKNCVEILYKFTSRARDEAGKMEKTCSHGVSESNAETKIRKKFTLASHFFLYQSAI
jgi:hypothetical protein